MSKAERAESREPATELPMSKLAINDDDEFVVWSEVAKRLLPGDHFAFAMTSKVHRRAVRSHLGPNEPISTKVDKWQQAPSEHWYSKDWLDWIMSTQTILEGMRPHEARHKRTEGIDGELCSDDKTYDLSKAQWSSELYQADVMFMAGFLGYFDHVQTLTKQGTLRHTDDPLLSSC